MPPKKIKTTVAKKKTGKPAKHKQSKVNKRKTKATKRKTHAKKRRDKYKKKQRKARKKTDKKKRAAKKKASKTKKKTKNTKKKTAAKKKTKKKKSTEPKPGQVGKQEAPSDEEDEGGDGAGFVNFKFTGLSVFQMQNLRKQVVELTKEEFLEQLMDTLEDRSDEAKMQAAFLGTPEKRMKLFGDAERPTDGSAGPFLSNRFGAVFLMPGQ